MAPVCCNFSSVSFDNISQRPALLDAPTSQRFGGALEEGKEEESRGLKRRRETLARAPGECGEELGECVYVGGGQ